LYRRRRLGHYLLNDVEICLENRPEEGWQLPAEYEIVRVAVGS